MWCVMAKSCLPSLCRSCACSTQYHSLAPLPLHFQRAASPSEPTMQQPPHRASVAGETVTHGDIPWQHCALGAGGKKGRGMWLWPLPVLLGAPDLWPFPKHTCPFNHTHTQNNNPKQKSTHLSKRNVCTESKREKIPNFPIHSDHLNQCACD